MCRWVITDTHFNHENIKAYCGRPDNFQELIIKHWSEMVLPEDIVYHLGDVIFAKSNELYNMMYSLPGKKILIKGNHDKKSDTWYMDNGFDFVCNALMVGDVLLSHAPMKLTDDIYMNIHGHFHNTEHRTWEPSYQDIYTDRHYCLSIEKTNYKPVLIEQITRR